MLHFASIESTLSVPSTMLAVLNSSLCKRRLFPTALETMPMVNYSSSTEGSVENWPPNRSILLRKLRWSATNEDWRNKKGKMAGPSWQKIFPRSEDGDEETAKCMSYMDVARSPTRSCSLNFAEELSEINEDEDDEEIDWKWRTDVGLRMSAKV